MISAWTVQKSLCHVAHTHNSHAALTKHYGYLIVACVILETHVVSALFTAVSTMQALSEGMNVILDHADDHCRPGVRRRLIYTALLAG